MNPTGAAFCPNVYTKSYTQLLAQVTERFAHSCHTNDRANIYECLYPNIESEDDVSLLNDFIIEHYEREHSALIRDNDQCMRKHSATSQYWDARLNQTVREEIGALTVKTSASIMMRPSFYVLMVSFMVITFLSYK
eukprot:403376771